MNETPDDYFMAKSSVRSDENLKRRCCLRLVYVKNVTRFKTTGGEGVG